MSISQDRELVVPRIAPPELVAALRERFGEGDAAFCVLQAEQLGRSVYRLQLEANGSPHSVVVKRLEQAIGRRVALVNERWLPAVGLEHAGPPLLAAAGEPDGQHVWH